MGECRPSLPPVEVIEEVLRDHDVGRFDARDEVGVEDVCSLKHHLATSAHESCGPGQELRFVANQEDHSLADFRPHQESLLLPRERWRRQILRRRRRSFSLRHGCIEPTRPSRSSPCRCPSPGREREDQDDSAPESRPWNRAPRRWCSQTRRSAGDRAGRRAEGSRPPARRAPRPDAEGARTA